MQQATSQQSVTYASLGFRFAAVVIDSFVLLAVYLAAVTVWAFTLVSRYGVNAQDTAAVQNLLNEHVADISSSTFYLVLFGSLFIYYLLLEAIFSASVGKLALGMRVVMADGSRPTGLALVLRNLVRLPEAMFLYVPAGLSCAASPRRQRLGDHAARTVVVRRQQQVTVVYGSSMTGAPFSAPPAPPGPAPVAPAPAHAAPGTAWQQDPPAATEPLEAEEALSRLKTAALAARGAHLTYLRFSERELAAGGGQAGGYSEGYVSAWFTLTDAVATLQRARADLDAATGAAGQPSQLATTQPDLAHLLTELEPYFSASGDEAVHAAFLTVARAEAAGS